MTLEEYYTAIESAHPETVKRLCRQGDLPAQEFRNTWLIRWDVLEVFSSSYDPRSGARSRLL